MRAAPDLSALDLAVPELSAVDPVGSEGLEFGLVSDAPNSPSAPTESAALESRSWEDEVVDQLADLSEDEFENLLNDSERLAAHELAPALDTPYSEMSNELEVQLDARTAEIAAEEAASLTEYQSEDVTGLPADEQISSFVYTGSLENVDSISADTVLANAANAEEEETLAQVERATETPLAPAEASAPDLETFSEIHSETLAGHPTHSDVAT